MFRLCYCFPSVFVAVSLVWVVSDLNVPAIAQVSAAGDPTGTVVHQDGSDFEITGGMLSGDRHNLFHNFSSFNLNADQSATFFADPTIQNILSKISSGDASLIDGLIRVRGSEANLFLLNASGIVFGRNAMVDVGGDFTASTATTIGFGDEIWQEGTDYGDLVGSPTRFYFDGTAAIINAADLTVGTGNNINLFSSNIVNTGSLVAREGNIQVLAVPGTNVLYLHQNGLILGLEVAPQDSPLMVTNLAELLTGSDLETGVSITGAGNIQLDGNQAIASPLSGVATVSGTVTVASPSPQVLLDAPLFTSAGDATSTTGLVLVTGATLNEQGSQFIPVTGEGGAIAVLGREVVLREAHLDASGENGGGNIRIGGDYQGLGELPAAWTTVVDDNSVLNVSATGQGDGGEVIVWADGATWFHGTATARGGSLGGDGGFIETSGKHFLDVTHAQIDTSAMAAGNTGTWLLDPVGLTITDNTASSDSNITGEPNFQTISGAGMSTLSKQTLEAALAVNNVTITTAGGVTADSGDLILDATIDSDSNHSLTLTSRGFILSQGGFNLGGDLTFHLNSINPITGASSLLGESLQAAHDAIGAIAGTTTINLGAGTYQQGSEFVFTKDLTLNGAGVEATFLDGDHLHRVVSNSGNLTLNHLTVQNGYHVSSGTVGAVLGRGGGIYNSGTLSVTHSLIVNNQSDYGGGIANDGTLILSDSTVDQNDAYYEGGGLWHGGTGAIANSTFSNNTAGFFGGGIENYGALTLKNSTFMDNLAHWQGGAIDNFASGLLTVANSTFSGNRADVQGGAIANDASEGLQIQNSTFSQNAAESNGGSIWNNDILILTNTIIANSPSGGDIFNSDVGHLTLAESNLIETGTILGGGSVTGDITLSGDPLLSPLGDYGGATQTFALLPGSIAIDAAGVDGTIADQRGLGIVGSRDLGAFESQGFTLTAVTDNTSQSTIVHQEFTNPLGVTITANNPDEPIADGIITFQAPPSGAGLAGVTTAMVSASGVAELIAKANTISGGYIVSATATGVSQPVDFSLTNLAGAIANITINAGNQQNTVVNTNFTKPLTLTATDQFGNVVPNATIALSAPETGASLKTPSLSLTTDTLGNASTILTANTIAGVFTINLTGEAGSNSLTLRNKPDVPSGIKILSGDNQSTTVNTNFGQTLIIDVFDQFGNRVPNASIQLSAPGTFASLNTPNFSIVTNGVGRASTTLTANTIAGSFDVALNSLLGSASGNLSLDNLAGAIANITINTGNQQNTVVNTNFTKPLTLTATDQFGNVVPNATIHLTAPSTGASLNRSSLNLTTNNLGKTSTTLTANTIAGEFSVNLIGGNGNNNLTLTNLADKPHRLTILNGNNQSTTVNTPFDNPLTVQVFDQYNNLVPNAQVQVTVPSTGAGLNTSNFSLLTNDQGQATTELTANTRAGDFNLALNLPQTSISRNVALGNVADQAAIIVAVGGNGQTTNVGEAFTDPLKVKVTDQFGNPIGNFPVTFHVQKGATGAIAILEETSRNTDPNGIATMPLSANGIGGVHQVLAHGQGLNSIAFNLENKPLNESNCPPDCHSQRKEPTVQAITTANSPIVQDPAALPEQTFSTAEIEQSSAYGNFLGIPPAPPLSVTEAQASLATLDAQTDSKTAYISLQFRPSATQDNADPVAVSPHPSPGLKTVKPLTLGSGSPPTDLHAQQDSLNDVLEVVITTGDNQIVVQSLPITRRELIKLNSELLRMISRPEAVFRKRLRANAMALYQQTFAPLEETLQTFGIDNVLLSLGADLRSVPWGVLFDGDRYLVEKYSIGITPNLSLTDTNYRPWQDRGVLVMGASDFEQLEDLPAVPTEIAMVAEQFDAPRYFLNQEFTRENLIAARREIAPAIIHLATHASFVGGDLSRSYIQLWGDERLPISEMDDLQWFTEPPVELLVLSACQTALGDATSDLGFGGLAVKSGVRSAIASLWSVSDVGTLALMREFYRNLADPTIRTKAKALQQAQIALIRGEVQIEGNQLRGGERSPYVIDLPETSGTDTLALDHPYSWAAFTLIGSPW